jgi:hypothetical protein
MFPFSTAFLSIIHTNQRVVRFIKNLLLGLAFIAVSAASPTPEPAPDRLAEPTLPPNPGQADLGAQNYWLNCMPCHGDRGQGLTDEFRNLYPEEDRNCWASGCHGGRPYEDGFTLPTSVPPLIGPQALGPFDTAASLHTFISSAMPYQARGSLDEDTYWQITAFLLRENGLNPLNDPLGPDNASRVRLRPESTAVASDPSENSPIGAQDEFGAPALTPGVSVHTSKNNPLPPIPAIALAALIILGLALLLKKRKAGRP